ncbi:DUF5665 domain-containing protein [Brevibacillus humidisoli]|uniref:DUF5665 domain-containing protein n=1 Tax=Brevibacillus humidisoli TaxID=2895522 RepID=UPI001E59EB7A|nr:DUF5665 domain-containing protein [Brevibacillus humidisoli]UFJ41884.1 DUF5665 domain-containing protein [Brevibacillus humidisoli]
MSRSSTPTEELIDKVDQLLKHLEEVRGLNKRLDKIAIFLQEIQLVDVLQNYTTPRRLLFTNFLAGLARGLGLTIGTAIILGVFGWFLKPFLSVPIIGEYVRQLIDYVNAYRQ